MTKTAAAACGDPVRVPLSMGLEALIDPADQNLVCGLKWHANVRRGRRYAFTYVDGVRTPMHRLILNPARGELVDHINGDGLDNRRDNLRLCAHKENMRNKRIRNYGRKTSVYKGVQASGKRWAAVIQQNGQRLRLGTFDTECQAAKAYDAAAKVFFGRFACTNADMGLLPL